MVHEGLKNIFHEDLKGRLGITKKKKASLRTHIGFHVCQSLF